jgi:GTPase SAR1 family protein
MLVLLLDHLQVFLGDQSVGKTSIITRFMYDKFDNTYQVRCCQTCLLLCSLSMCACLVEEPAAVSLQGVVCSFLQPSLWLLYMTTS